ncbi:MAG: shikimate dehydrogenase [Acidobacteria bacterium]|nr:shikimate dehydrogenase [Acidobacteriota bacterium]
MRKQLRYSLRQTRLVELRLDWLKNDLEIMQFAGALLEKRSRATYIATCRTKAGGGKLAANGRGAILSQLFFLAGYAKFGCKWCDIELQSLKAPPEVFRVFFPHWPPKPSGQPRFILSSHLWDGTPANIDRLIPKLGKLDANAIKIAAHCNSIADSLRVLALAKGKKNVIAVPMGEFGLPARVLALREGSALAYAAVGEKTAPGQLTLDEMKNLYRADKLNRKTRVYGVIGDPVSHSLSPLMHNLAFHQRKINAVYLPFLVRDLKDFLRAIKPLGIAGFSVTLPHKEKILRYLDDCDPLAATIGAVNTVVVRGNGKLYGSNTDYVGVLRALERRVSLCGSRVLIFGAGGVARAVAFALAQAGSIVCICARRMGEAEKLARAVGGEAVARARIRKEFFDAIVNATPVGMHPKAGESPLRADELNCRLVFDTVYRPMKTKLLQLAEKRGIETVSGVEMFIAQGTAQWEIWTDRRAPVALMRKAVLKALRDEGKA